MTITLFRWKSFCLTVLSASALTILGMPLFAQGIHECTIDKSAQTVLVKDGQSVSEIFIEKNSAPTVKFAAKELQDFIRESTGAEIKIVNSRNESMPGIALGETKLAAEAGIDIKNLPRDGFFIKTVGNTIFILGKDDPTADITKTVSQGVHAQWFERATLFAVYDFLERFAGTRFYFPGKIGTVIPQTKNLSIPSVNITEAPDFSVSRKVSLYDGQWYEDDQSFTPKNLNMYRLRFQTKYVPNCHGLSRLNLSERFKDKSEFFALLPNGKRDNDLSLPGHHGHLCFTNKELEDEIYGDAKAFLTGQSAQSRGIKVWRGTSFQPGYFNVMPQDGHGPYNFCRCTECWKYYGNDKAGELVWSFVGKIADRLTKDGIKGYVTAMAYGACRDVPEAKIPDNVLVMLALTGPWQENAPAIQAKNDQLIKDWDKKLAPGKVWLWNYAGKYKARSFPGIPASTPRAIASYYKRNAPYITGAYLESETDYYIFAYLNYYVFFKLAWNSSIDAEELLKEHDRIMFGPASEQMGKFFSKIETLWTSDIIGKITDTPLGPQAAIPSETKTFNEVYSEKTVSDMQKLFSEAEKLTEGNAEYASRVAFIKKNFLDRITEARKSYFDRKKEQDDLVFEVLPLNGNAMVIDGKLDDEAWKNTTSLFMVPLNADKALVKTKFAGTWDDKYLYLSVDCEEPETSKLSMTKRKNDDELIWQDASVEIFLNFSDDAKTYYQFIINPYGSFSDQMATIDGKKSSDWSWNSNAEIKTNIENGKRWTAEIKIPLSSFKNVNFRDGNKFRANFTRSRNLKNVSKEENQFYTWSPFLKNGFHDLENFGFIQFSQKKTEDNSIIKNGGFNELKKNSAPAEWNLPREEENKKRINIDHSIFIDGGQSIKIESNANNDLSITQQLPDLKANSKYRLTFFIKTENLESAGNGGAFVNIYTDKNEHFPLNYYQDTIPWCKQSFEITTGPDVNKKTKSYIRLRVMNASGSVWFDDVKLREISK